ncbi:unnamed protein product [Ranitomeya imitator]|uniref:VWFD domain-containing protein n=1 Tax=Ranitomeya imitator TaxID=111125 RepID=A0ABN9M4J8_9NEOB|nr:unnamed protein product [Ranitomeya imitator]
MSVLLRSMEVNWVELECTKKVEDDGSPSEEVEQAQADSRYRQTKAGESDYIKLFRSTSPNWHNAGVRCVYYRKNQFLEGFQERTWTFHSSSNNVQDAELQAYDWCCNDVDDPQFCTMYKQKRPPITCLDYRPPRPGGMFGDPHIMTLDGLTYTFNGLGDFLLLNASDSEISLALQGRTVQTEPANATNFQAFAVQYTSSNASVKVSISVIILTNVLSDTFRYRKVSVSDWIGRYSKNIGYRRYRYPIPMQVNGTKISELK